MNDHLSDAAIQEIALEDRILSHPPHLEQCVTCRSKMQQYRTIFKALGQLETPVLGIQLADSVMFQFITKGHKTSTDLSYIFIGLSVLAAGLICYLLFPATTWKALMQKSWIGIALLILSAAGLLFFFITVQWKQYRHQLKIIDQTRQLQPDF